MTTINSILVTIGIPTYNRASSLDATIASAVDQNYSCLEIIVCDNSSTDSTKEICVKWMRQDSRVKYYCNLLNIGAVANFNSLPKLAIGEYFMWLADDDRISQNYVRECLSVHLKQPDTALASGVSYYGQSSEQLRSGVVISACSRSPWLRVFKYLILVRDNSGFYGLMKTEHARKFTLKNVLAGDWLLVMNLAFQGRLRIARHASLMRSSNGVSKDVDALMCSYGYSRLARVFPYHIISNEVRKELWSSPVVVTRAGWIKRGILGLIGSSLCVLFGQGLLWRSISMMSKILSRLISRKQADRLKWRLRNLMDF